MTTTNTSNSSFLKTSTGGGVGSAFLFIYKTLDKSGLPKGHTVTEVSFGEEGQLILSEPQMVICKNDIVKISISDDSKRIIFKFEVRNNSIEYFSLTGTYSPKPEWHDCISKLKQLANSIEDVPSLHSSLISEGNYSTSNKSNDINFVKQLPEVHEDLESRDGFPVESGVSPFVKESKKKTSMKLLKRFMKKFN